MIDNNNVVPNTVLPREEGGRLADAANLVSTVFSPALVVFYSAVLWSYSADYSSKLLWTSVFALLFVVLPTAYIFRLMSRGGVTDFHISVREERIRPICTIFVYSVLCLVLYGLAGGPEGLVFLGALCLVLTALWILVSLFWKISGHCAGMGALLAVALASGYESLIFVLPPLAVLVAWSRIRLRCHTPAQTAAGFVLGLAVLGVASFPLF